MELTAVKFEVRDGIGICTLNQPKQMNALSRQLRADVSQVWDEFERNKDIAILIMTGTDPAFCAGGDLSDMPRTAAGGKEFLRDIIRWLARPEKIAKPLIAAVNGYALGGGLELAIACDIIIASEKARFGVPEVSVGLVPGFAMLRLHEIVGRARAKELAFTGKHISAQEAYQMGMINKVVPHEELLDAAIEMAKTIMQKTPLGVQLLKATINRHLGGEDLAYAIESVAHLFATEDANEGISAFVEKRKPVYKGR